MENRRNAGLRRKCSKPRTIKHNNQKLVLSMFRYAECLSVSQIARQSGLSKTTITKIIGDFLEKGLIESAGKGDSTDEGGKKPELFSFNPTCRCGFLIHLDLSAVVVSLLDLNCRCLDSIRVDGLAEGDYDAFPRAAGEAARTLLSRNAGVRIGGAVVASDGILDVDNGVIRYSVQHPWRRDLPICRDVAEKLPVDVPVYVENASAMRGYAQLLEEDNQASSSLVYLLTGSVHSGGCVLKNHELVHGAHGFMSEFGHIVVNPASHHTCLCGSKGCFEVMTSEKNVLRNARKWRDEYPDSPICEALEKKTLSMQMIFDLSNSGDSFACRLMDDVIHWFSVLIRTIMIAHDPEKIIIGGVYQTAGRYFLETLHSMVSSTPFFRTGADLPVCYAEGSPEEASLRGASYYLCRRIIDNSALYD